MNYNKLEDARVEQGISVMELCRRSGVSRSEYYRILKGERSPKFEIITKLCIALGVDPNELM